MRNIYGAQLFLGLGAGFLLSSCAHNETGVDRDPASYLPENGRAPQNGTNWKWPDTPPSHLNAPQGATQHSAPVTMANCPLDMNQTYIGQMPYAFSLTSAFDNMVKFGTMGTFNGAYDRSLLRPYLGSESLLTGSEVYDAAQFSQTHQRILSYLNGYAPYPHITQASSDERLNGMLALTLAAMVGVAKDNPNCIHAIQALATQKLNTAGQYLDSLKLNELLTDIVSHKFGDDYSKLDEKKKDLEKKIEHVDEEETKAAIQDENKKKRLEASLSRELSGVDQDISRIKECRGVSSDLMSVVQGSASNALAEAQSRINACIDKLKDAQEDLRNKKIDKESDLQNLYSLYRDKHKLDEKQYQDLREDPEVYELGADKAPDLERIRAAHKMIMSKEKKIEDLDSQIALLQDADENQGEGISLRLARLRNLDVEKSLLGKSEEKYKKAREDLEKQIAPVDTQWLTYKYFAPQVMPADAMTPYYGNRSIPRYNQMQSSTKWDLRLNAWIH